jgi:CD109 antigen
VVFDVPADWEGDCTFSAQVAGIAEDLVISTAVEQRPALLIETDKPIYKPSQEVHGRVVLLNSSMQPVSGDVEVTVHDAKGLRINRWRLQADQYGSASFDLQLAREVNFGTWKIRAVSGKAETLKDIRVENYTLPRFELDFSLPKSWVLVDQRIRGQVRADYFFGKPVNGTARIVARRWVGTWDEYASFEAELLEGQADFDLPAVGFVSGTAQESGQGTVTLEVSVTDTAGHTQETTEVLTVSEAPVVLSIIPGMDTVKAGIPLL